MISETRIDYCFPTEQLYMQGCSVPFRRDRTLQGGGILLLVRVEIPYKMIKVKTNTNFDIFFIEINLRNKKWLPSCPYNPHQNNISSNLETTFRNSYKKDRQNV